jgi:predicted kinase
MQSFKSYIEEGVNDPAIFKAVFLAGGPGSGKSFIVGQTALQSLGFKLINSDPAFERALEKAGLDKKNPDDIFSEPGQLARVKAKALTDKQMQMAIDGRLGLVIDGTGKDANKIKKQAVKLKQLGYEVALVFVNTDLETAVARNQKRDRQLPDAVVKKMWNDVQKNIGTFQAMFGQYMFVIDNSDDSDWKSQVRKVYNTIRKWSNKDPRMPQAKAWITARKPK